MRVRLRSGLRAVVCCVVSSDVKLHLFQKGGQSFCETSANFMDSLRTYDIYWESQVDGTMASFIVG